MILDTSALLAVLLREAEAERLEEAMESANVVRLSVASYGTAMRSAAQCSTLFSAGSGFRSNQ